MKELLEGNIEYKVSIPPMCLSQNSDKVSTFFLFFFC